MEENASLQMDKTKGVKGISMFLVDAGTPGLSTGNEEN